MLVGAIAYALPPEQELSALVPALAGSILAVANLVAMANDNARKPTMYINALVGLLLLIYTSGRIVPDVVQFTHGQRSTFLVADLDVLVMSAVYLFLSLRRFLEVNGVLKQERA